MGRFVSRMFPSGVACLMAGYAACFSWNPPAPAQGAPVDGPDIVNVRSKSSILHLGSLDSFDISDSGKQAARLLLDNLDTHNPDSAKQAIAVYERIIPNENFGGEYTALEWLCNYQLADAAKRKQMVANPITASWYDTLAKDDYAPLRNYLKRKYHLQTYTDSDDPNVKKTMRFLEDFILFNNPDRERWEKTSKIIEAMHIKPGESIADVGSGPGYYSFKFGQMVGDSGKVYAIDNNTMHLKYLNDYIKAHDIKNVNVVEAQPAGIGVKDKVDLVYMCSLYHIVYTTFSAGERDLFIGSIKNCLKPNGRFIVVDNDLVEDRALPYHGPYIERNLIISQLHYFGFDLVATQQFTPQRYVLEFKLSPNPPKEKMVESPAIMIDPVSATQIRVTSRASLLRCLKGGTSPGFTIGGKKAARLFMTALEKKDAASAAAAKDAYVKLMPTERIGDEYSAFVWFCDYLLATPQQQKEILKDHLLAEYYNFLAKDDYTLLKKYVRCKYYLEQPDPVVTEEELKSHEPDFEYKGTEVSLDQLNDWGDFIAFNNPNREMWEKTSKMLEFFKIREGEVIADVGCGPGYYTFKFAQRVGKTGKVYAVDTSADVLDYVSGVAKKYEFPVEPVKSKFNDACLPPNSVDTVYICSMYHAVYVTSIEFVKDEFVVSLKKALKKDGRLIIADNTITPPSAVPYYGPGIARELVIAQLKYYGFRLVDSAQFIPQRYVLVFKLAENDAAAATAR